MDLNLEVRYFEHYLIFDLKEMDNVLPDYESSDDEKPRVNNDKRDTGANLAGWNDLFLKD